jgi:hypothetical protein
MSETDGQPAPAKVAKVSCGGICICMYVCVYMFVCMHACMYVSMYVCMYTHTHTHTHTHRKLLQTSGRQGAGHRPCQGEQGTQGNVFLICSSCVPDVFLMADLVKENKALKAQILKSALYRNFRQTCKLSLETPHRHVKSLKQTCKVSLETPHRPVKSLKQTCKVP